MTTPGRATRTSSSDGAWGLDVTERGERNDSAGGFVALLRERWKVIVAVALLTTVAAAAYVALAPRIYRAEADLLITPVARDNDSLAGLGLLRESSDPTRDVETVSRLIPTVEVSRRALAKVPPAFQDDFQDVEAAPVAQSSIVAIVADARSAQAAATWANAYAEAFLEVRTEALRRRAASAIAGLEARLSATNNQSVQDQLSFELSQLQRVQEGNDPTIDLQTRATPPESQLSPRPALSLATGLIFGTIFGVGAGFLLQRLDPRLRRESQLRGVFPLPILARISLPGRSYRRRATQEGAGGSSPISPSVVEAAWPLRALLPSHGADGGSGSLAITSADPGEGKSTVALGLAYSLALTGEPVILIEADLRRPTLARMLGVAVRNNTAGVLTGAATLEDALVSSPKLPGALQMLLADASDADSARTPDGFVLNVPRLIEEAMEIARYVIIDAPPLSETVEGLSLVEAVDDVLLVVRHGRTRLARLAELRELLTHDLAPAGFAVVSR